MTGLEIVAIKDGKARLFKVRHDGYEIESYIDKFKVPQGNSTLESIKHFKDFFFGPQGPDPRYDVETNFPDGFEFTPNSKNPFDVLLQSQDEIDSLGATGTLTIYEGFCCSYGDYNAIFDLDSGVFLRIDEDYESMKEEDELDEDELSKWTSHEEYEDVQVYTPTEETV